MPDWQPGTMRFFCYQEQQGISSLGFPDSLHQCLSEKLHPSHGCSGLGFLRENNYWDSNETPHWRSCENHTFSVKKSPEAGNPSHAAGWGNLLVGTVLPQPARFGEGAGKSERKGSNVIWNAKNYIPLSGANSLILDGIHWTECKWIRANKTSYIIKQVIN